MKGDAQPLIKFFDGSDKRFIIPLYQRNYDWKEENCEQLFNDLLNLHESNRKSHFFGSIVSIIQPGKLMQIRIDGRFYSDLFNLFIHTSGSYFYD